MPLMTATELLTEAIAIAAEELCVEPEGLSRDSRLDQIFADSLEYVAFTIKLGSLGHLSEEAISHAETIGDLVDAIDHTN